MKDKAPPLVETAPTRRVTSELPPIAALAKGEVRDNQLHLPGHGGPEAYCTLETTAWFAWLETASAFRYQSARRLEVARGYTRPLRPISLRQEKRRRGFLWYAYLRLGGQLLKRYAGRSQALTVARLDELAMELNLG